MTDRVSATAALVIVLLCTVPCAFARVVQTPPAATAFDLGRFEVSILRDGALAFPNNCRVFATNATPVDVSRVLKEAGARPDMIQLDIDVLLIRMPHHVVMLDAGLGLPGKSVLRESLELAGVSPEDVTDVLITHAHPDHVGGLVDAQGNSAFPNANIRMSARTWSFMHMEDAVRAQVPVIEEQVRTFDPGRPVLPGITPVALPGHTHGHVGYEIVSDGHRLMDIGDLAHNSIISLARPEWTLAWDSDKQEAAGTRRRELQRLADTHELIFAPHFPFPGIGRIRRAGNGFTFRAGLPGEPTVTVAPDAMLDPRSDGADRWPSVFNSPVVRDAPAPAVSTMAVRQANCRPRTGLQRSISSPG